jgi:hypothetical protein
MEMKNFNRKTIPSLMGAFIVMFCVSFFLLPCFLRSTALFAQSIDSHHSKKKSSSSKKGQSSTALPSFRKKLLLPKGSLAIATLSTNSNAGLTVAANVTSNVLMECSFNNNFVWDNNARTLTINNEGSYYVYYFLVCHPLVNLDVVPMSGAISLMVNGIETITTELQPLFIDPNPLLSQYSASISKTIPLASGDVLTLQGVSNGGLKFDLPLDSTDPSAVGLFILILNQ